MQTKHAVDATCALIAGLVASGVDVDDYIAQMVSMLSDRRLASELSKVKKQAEFRRQERAERGA